MIKTALLVCAALSMIASPVFAESTDGSRSDSTFVRSPDHSKVPKGARWNGDGTARSGSRSDSTFIPNTFPTADPAGMAAHNLYVKNLHDSGMVNGHMREAR